MQWSKTGELLGVHELRQTYVSIASNRLPAGKLQFSYLHGNGCCIVDGSYSERRLKLQVGSYKAGYGYGQGVGASYPGAGRGGRPKHGIGGRNRQLGGRRRRGSHSRGGRGRAGFGCRGQCWPLPNLPIIPAAATPATPVHVPPIACPAADHEGSAPGPAVASAPVPTPTPPTLPPAAAPAVAFSSNKAAAAALRAQKHKHPIPVPAAMADHDADSQRNHKMDAQPPTPAPATNATPVVPVTPLSQHVKTTGKIHQKSGGRTRPLPQAERKGPQHQQGQPNPHSPAYPPVGDPVQHQAFLPNPSKRQAPKPMQQGRLAIAEGFGTLKRLAGTG